MEKCYVCNHCGKCGELELAIAPDGPRCLDCGREVQPGEKMTECAGCGSARIGFAGPGKPGAPAR
ncbi:hypothetical protein VJ923_05775 [Adlercreutzia sp. R25]|uniref:Uncharacterized protein n=1 Tax=Adlercreutzia shanghongiae TaxID=3111773 RepID=A0ABU6IXK1_9ACTN|nr:MULTISPECIES: hypothetical protein [unclassified Adlercreutzia]MEC4272666.1 hypothetical protein [Adlercreutzia sp. R25]MEC4294433.1 hypothetical protein [Adlercreutzia sp. R22]